MKNVAHATLTTHVEMFLWLDVISIHWFIDPEHHVTREAWSLCNKSELTRKGFKVLCLDFCLHCRERFLFGKGTVYLSNPFSFE